jgi:hypothetical protein
MEEITPEVTNAAEESVGSEDLSSPAAAVEFIDPEDQSPPADGENWLGWKSKLVVMQQLADAVGHGFTWWQFGLVTSHKMRMLRQLFAELYGTDESKFTRYRRRKAGRAAAMLVEYPAGDKTAFFLLATDGKGLIHEREKLADATEKKSRIQLTGYELVHDGVTWSWRMSSKTYQNWKDRLTRAISMNNDLELRRAIHTLFRTPGFRLCRKQVGYLSVFYRETWKRLRAKTDPLPPLPTFLAYVRRLPAKGKRAA